MRKISSGIELLSCCHLRLVAASSSSCTPTEELLSDKLTRENESFQALAIFWYLHNRNDNWKSGGIKDEDIVELNFTPPGEDDRIRVRCGIYSIFVDFGPWCKFVDVHV